MQVSPKLSVDEDRRKDASGGKNCMKFTLKRSKPMVLILLFFCRAQK